MKESLNKRTVSSWIKDDMYAFEKRRSEKPLFSTPSLSAGQFTRQRRKTKLSSFKPQSPDSSLPTMWHDKTPATVLEQRVLAAQTEREVHINEWMNYIFIMMKVGRDRIEYLRYGPGNWVASHKRENLLRKTTLAIHVTDARANGKVSAVVFWYFSKCPQSLGLFGSRTEVAHHNKGRNGIVSHLCRT